jgi:SAM-dependent methyltransferase
MDRELYRRFFEIEDRFWWSVGTRRIFFQLIDGLEGNGRLLDVGCGTGVFLKEFPGGWKLLAGCDHSDDALSFSAERGLRALARCDATRLPYASGAFDLVTALDVVEHLDDDEGCLREIARVTRAGGHVLLHVPAFQVLWTDKDALSHHRRRYHRAELIALTERAGLQIERLFYINAFLVPAALLRAAAQRLWASRRGSAAATVAAIDPLYRTPAPVNRLMTGLVALERRIAARIPMPFGMSLVCLARKPPSLSDGRAGRASPAARSPDHPRRAPAAGAASGTPADR